VRLIFWRVCSGVSAGRAWSVFPAALARHPWSRFRVEVRAIHQHHQQ
jgi:hypothetical protein